MKSPATTEEYKPKEHSDDRPFRLADKFRSQW